MWGSYRGPRLSTIAALLLVSFPAAAQDLLPAVGHELEALRMALFPGRTPESVVAVRTTSVLSVGGTATGRSETVARRDPRAMRELLDVAGVVQVATLRDGEGWFRDPNGQVRAATGDELASYLLAHSLLFHDYLNEDPPGFRREVTPMSITFVPTGEGAPRILELTRTEDGDLLPARFHQRQQGTDIVTSFSDWRVVDGVLFPFRSVQHSGDPRFDIVMTATSVEFPSGLSENEIPRPEPGGSREDAKVHDADAARDIPIEMLGSLVCVDVLLNDDPTPAHFLLDTGAAATVLSEALAERLGLEPRGMVEARGTGGSEAAHFVDVKSLRLPGIEVQDQTVVALPLRELGIALGRPVDGILGYDFLSRFAVEIDYRTRRLSVLEAGTYEPTDDMYELELRVESNVPRIQARLDDQHTGSLVLDLGNATTLVIHTAFAREHGYLERAESSSLTLSGIGGDQRLRQIRVESLRIGELEFTDVPAVVAASDEGALALDESMGNAGSQLFAGRRLAFDYGAGMLWVEALASDSASSR